MVYRVSRLNGASLLNVASGSSRASYLRSIQAHAASSNARPSRLPRARKAIAPAKSRAPSPGPLARQTEYDDAHSSVRDTELEPAAHELVDTFWEISAEDLDDVHSQAHKSRRSAARAGAIAKATAARKPASLSQYKSRAFAMRVAEDEWLQDDAPALAATRKTQSSTKEHHKKSHADFKTRALRHNEGIYKKVSAHSQRSQPRRVKPAQVHVPRHEPHGEGIASYNERFRPLLAAEQASEESLIQERLRRPVAELQEEGYCVLGLSAFWLEATQFGLPVAVFSLGPGVTLGATHFENGAQVMVTRNGPFEEKPLLGCVIGKTATQLRVTFDERHDLETGLWRLDLASSDIAFTRMRAALDHLHFDPEKLAEQSTQDQETILLGTHLRDLLLKGFAAPSSSSTPADVHADDEPALSRGQSQLDALFAAESADADAVVEGASESTGTSAGVEEVESEQPLSVLSGDQALHSWAQRYQRADPIVLPGDPVLDLNPSQVAAVATMLGNRLSLVQGPPGTGKSKTIVEAVRILKKHFQVSIPLLVCTYTNMAVDNLVESFAKAGVEPLRVGFAGRVATALHRYTLDSRVETHHLKPEVDKLRADLGAAERRLENVEALLLAAKAKGGEKKRDTLDAKRATLLTKVAGLRRRRWGKEREMLTDIVSKADVICTTAITSACAALQVIDFPIVFMDEASMSTEPAAIIPIMRGSQHVALVGDHKQLPPIVTSTEALAGGLGVSLFERLVSEGDTPLVMLAKQYRMHPEISKFPSHEFYDKKLQDGTVDAAGLPAASWAPPISSFLPFNPITGRWPSAIFLDHAAPESRRGRSIENVNEADIICYVIEDLLMKNPTMTGHDIGVIAPYAAQIKLVTAMLRTDPERRKRFIDVLGRHRALEVPLIEVKTVDGFEGREKDVILFSTVRSNRTGQIGFLADRRRLNVGLTRAKRGLFVVGNTPTLLKGNVSVFGNTLSMVSYTTPQTQVQVTKPMYSNDGVWGRFVNFMMDHQLVATWQHPQHQQQQQPAVLVA